MVSKEERNQSVLELMMYIQAKGFNTFFRVKIINQSYTLKKRGRMDKI